MMLYNYSYAMVRFPYGNTDYFEVIAGVLQRDTLALYHNYSYALIRYSGPILRSIR